MKQNFFNSDVEIEEIGASFKTKKAKITEKNIPYIFSILANFYSKPKASVVREITSNCFDAHIMVNKPDEIAIVRLFIDESGQYFIEFVDKGPGMSEQTMDEIFMNYGESTKRESDDFIGCFGLGSKSPFSVSDYFYVITKHDGIESTYLLNSTQMVEPTYDCLIRTELSDKNDCGTIIRVPIKQNEIKDWENAIIRELRYFKNVFVVNFENVVNDYKIHKFENYQIREDLFLQNPHDNLHLTLGDVTYPIRFSEIGYQNSFKFNAALTFNIGELSITPNREELKYDDKTIKVIKDKFEKFKNELYSQIYSKENINIDSFDKFIELQSDKVTNNNISVFNIIKDKKVRLDINTLNVENFEYKLKIINDYYKLPIHIRQINKFNVRSFGYDILYVKSKNHSQDFIKYNPNSTSYYDYLKNGNGNVCIVKYNERKIKKFEKLFLKDNQYKAIIYFNKENCIKKICALILKNNTIDLSSGIKFHNLCIELINKVKDYIETIYSVKDIDELNIPLNYGKVKKEKEKVKKLDQSILIYQCIYGSFERKEIFQNEIQDKEKITVYGTREDIENLKLIQSTFSTLIFYTSKSNLKYFENTKGYFYIADIFNESIKSNFFNEKEILDKLKDIFSSNLIRKDVKIINYNENKMFDLTYESEKDIHNKSDLNNKMIELFNYFIQFQNNFAQIYVKTINQDIKKLISENVIKILNKYSNKKLKIYTDLFKTQDKFFNEFYLENLLLTSSNIRYIGNDKAYQILDNNLKFKSIQLNKIVKTINKLKNEL